ncbi:MAG: insulinase family protein [Saprospiraceae bacterium]|nr:insulinase family protein [Saprospiraceae bacterium]MBP6565816.1 insulinase family protein [Saprospiraceae bacterium]
MITFERFKLANGLTVIIHEDKSTPMVAANVVYNVGSKYEEPDKTGFAHLFEHLMFGGSINIPDFDDHIQDAGGENNAFTNTDLTNFYEVLPAENIETALWLESDRMLQLRFSKKSLDTQKKVVIEEFKETCLNEPYGDMWHHLSRLCYKVHPYQWPTIGKDMSHIAEATLDQVKTFFYHYYRPDNAVLVLAGNIDVKKGIELVEKWFGSIPAGHYTKPNYLYEPPQIEFRQDILQQDVPHDAVYQGYHMAGRMDDGFYACDLLSDVLANGRSSRFYQRLYKEQELFSTIDAFISGTVDPGLFIIEGKTMPGISMEKAKKAIKLELDMLKNDLISEQELSKLKNSVESSLLYSEVSVLNKAISLAYFEVLGDADMINIEAERYHNVTAEDIRNAAQQVFREENCSEVLYEATEL